ncbi:hypothetical protein BH10ACT7_BH10ACT7_22230 [soil metagenome]
MEQNVPVIVASVAAIVVMLLSLAVVDSRMLPVGPLARSVLLSLGVGAVGGAAWLAIAPLLAPSLAGDLYVPIGALGAVAAFLATIAVRMGGVGTIGTLVFAGAWSAIVFVPAAILSFVGLPDFQPTDHGGSIAVNVAGGAAALGVLLVTGKRAQRSSPGPLPLPLGVVAVIALCVSWITWLVGAELDIDDVTPSIMLNSVVGAVAGMVGWLIVQRIRHQHTTVTAVAAGLVSGLVAITAGAALYTPVSAAVAGLVAGGIACIFTLRRTSATRRQQWFIVGSHLIAGAVGVALLGVLATDVGYLFTGDTGITFTGIFSFLERQVISTVGVAAYSCTVAVLLWFLVKRMRGSRA